MPDTLPPFTGTGELVATICPEQMDSLGYTPVVIRRNEVDGAEVTSGLLAWDDDPDTFTDGADTVLSNLDYRRTSQWSDFVCPVASVERI